jgi:transcriptional regulator with XRE-family HTH domain
MPKRDKSLTQFGRNVSRLRGAAGFSQDKLAEKAELDRTYLSGIERGVRNPGIKTVIRLAHALAVSVDQLCKGVEAPDATAEASASILPPATLHPAPSPLLHPLRLLLIVRGIRAIARLDSSSVDSLEQHF